MKIEQLYTGCLAQGAYYIRSGNEALIIDPLREVDPYIAKAKADGVTIRYVLETHFHADFVSGHLDLAAKTGATIVYGPTAKPFFKAHVATDGEVLRIGDVTIIVLHTPGHTMESVTYLLLDEHDNPHAIFSGDTLFLGDVGRPDLAQKAAHLTQEELAGLLFDSLRTKIMTLPDNVIVYPAHGAGSACGKNMMKETVDTLGHQKRTNYALRANMTRDEFIKEVTDGLLPPPAYFPDNVRMNKEGYESFDKVLSKGMVALSVDAFEAISTDALILDTRDAQTFCKGFIPGSINIGIDGSFAPWVGAMIPGVNHPILVVATPGREEETITRLARVGFDNTLGFLDGGFNSWENVGREKDEILSITAEAYAQRHIAKTVLIDVRKPGEYKAGHITGAINIPLDDLNNQLSSIPKKGDVYIHCGSGYRSMIAASTLKARGWNNLIEIKGGYQALSKTSLAREEAACASTIVNN